MISFWVIAAFSPERSGSLVEPIGDRMQPGHEWTGSRTSPERERPSAIGGTSVGSTWSEGAGIVKNQCSTDKYFSIP